jgi:hypothetical protein
MTNKSQFSIANSAPEITGLNEINKRHEARRMLSQISEKLKNLKCITREEAKLTIYCSLLTRNKDKQRSLILSRVEVFARKILSDEEIIDIENEFNISFLIEETELPLKSKEESWSTDYPEEELEGIRILRQLRDDYKNYFND